MKDPYEILGLPATATKDELIARYNELKAQYSEDRFATGEKGNEAAKNLSELEAAWNILSQTLNRQEEKETFGGDYGAIDDLIKKGSYDEAQTRLDEYSDRDAEWHYLQSILFYKREWLQDSRKQLVMAVNLAPNNQKYKTALEKMDMVMGNPTQDPTNLNGNTQNQMPPPNQNQEPGMMGGNCLSNCCLAYCLTDCCCSLGRCCG